MRLRAAPWLTNGRILQTNYSHVEDEEVYVERESNALHVEEVLTDGRYRLRRNKEKEKGKEIVTGEVFHKKDLRNEVWD